MSESINFTIGQRVLSGANRDLVGTVAYIGTTSFASGKWIGVILDEPKGKNNGSVQGVNYFECQDNYGVFVRQTQLSPLENAEASSGLKKTPSSSKISPKINKTSPTDSSKASLKSSKPMSQAQRRNQLTRLPIAGSGAKEPQKSLQSSPSGSRTNLATPTTTGQHKIEQNITKRQSFVETIAETIIPQYTQGSPGPLFTPILTPSADSERFGTAQLVEGYKNEIKDLNEKLDTLKTKRAADQERLRDLDRLKLQVETLSEFKSKVLESQASLQRELKKAKQDLKEAVESKEGHGDELSELSEAVEMATLDKEMAEEKAETLQLELESANEKIESLTSELNAIKDEMGGKVDPNTASLNSIQAKQLQTDNARMREALIKLRDSAAHDKHQHQKLVKEAETHKSEVIELSKTKDRLEKKCSELEAQVNELQELNDAALGAEEMVVNLTEKNLNLEEKVAKLKDEVADLEALQDVNDELQESAKELEMELRDELQKLIASNMNMTREKEALIETLSDRESTIVRFRELVQRLRDENDMLRRNLEEESNKPIPGLSEAMDFKKIFAESKAQTTAIDLELRRLEAKEASLHVTYLTAFMPDGFIKRGGDNDAILVLLLVPRMICKTELLLSQVREKLLPPPPSLLLPSSSNSGENNEKNEEEGDVASSPHGEKYAFCSQFSFLLLSLLSELRRWKAGLESCSTDDFLRIGLLLTDLSVQEKGLDFYLELLRRSQLDENIPLDGLEKCILSFQTFYSAHLGEEQTIASTLISDLCRASAAASDCLIIDVARLIFFLKKKEKESNVAIMLQDVKGIGESLRQLSKRTRRYLPDPPKQPPISNKLLSQMLNDAVTLTKVIKVFQETCKQASHHIGVTPEANEGIPSTKLDEYFQCAMEKCDSRVEGASGYREVIKEWLSTSLITMTDLAQAVNEAPVMPKEKPKTPLSLRSEAVKAELDQSKNLKIQLEDKEASIKELRKVLRQKQDELSELIIRKEIAEKKLSNSSKDNEMTIEKLTRKLEDVQTMLQRKEREFEATLEHFQTEIDMIESEKGELKEKLMAASKRRLLEGIAHSAASSPLSPTHGNMMSGSSLFNTTENNVSEISSSSLVEYTRYLQKQNWKLRSEQVNKIIKGLKPLNLPKKEDNDAIRQLEREYWKLKREWNTMLCDSLRIVMRNDLSMSRKEYLTSMNEAKKLKIQERMFELKGRINELMAQRNFSGVIKADFAIFSTDKSNKENMMNETVKVGMVGFPGWDKSKEKPRRIVLTSEQLQQIHKLLAPIN